MDTSNNVVGVIWDEAGVYTLNVFALNECGSGSGTKTITVIETIPVDGGDDVTICVGEAAIFSNSYNRCSILCLGTNWLRILCYLMIFILLFIPIQQQVI